MKLLIKHFKESGLAPETLLRTQRSRPFFKPENWLIFGILAGGDRMKIFWKASILQMAESNIFYVKWGADDDGASEMWLQLLFVELWAFLSPKTCPSKWAWKSAFYRNIWNAAAGQRRLWGHWTLLGLKVLIKRFNESGLVPETMLRTQRSRPYPRPEKWLVFGILEKGELQENVLESFNFTNGWKWHNLCKIDKNGKKEKCLWL